MEKFSIEINYFRLPATHVGGGCGGWGVHGGRGCVGSLEGGGGISLSERDPTESPMSTEVWKDLLQGRELKHYRTTYVY